MATPKAANRYPRPGQRLAPLALSDVLAVPLSGQLRDQLGVSDLRLCDLDKSVWQRFSADQIKRLAQAVVDHVSTHHTLKALRNRRFPRPLPGLRLDDLHLENRTRRCLIREGIDDQLARLGEYTLGDVLSFRAFGPRCLLDLLAALESAQYAAGNGTALGGVSEKNVSAELAAEAEKLAALEVARQVGPDDRRLGQLMQSIHIDANTALDLAEQLRTRRHNPPDAAYVLQQVRKLREAIENLPKLTLEEELIQIFATSPSKRNREVLLGYYGWEDGRTHTLTEIGDRFGITRERVRQICAKLIKRSARSATVAAPVMDRALALIEKNAPAPAATIEAELVEEGLTAVGMSLDAVSAGAELLGRPVSFKIVKIDQGKSLAGKRAKIKAKPAPARFPKKREEKSLVAVRADQAEAVQEIVDLAKKEVYFHGLTTSGRLERTLKKRYADAIDRRLVEQVLALIDGYCRLDETGGWFTLQGIAKHGLPKAVDKVLAVVGDVTVATMRTALARNHRLWRDPLPEKVLLAYCRTMPDVRVDGAHIRSDPPRNWKKVLTGVEAKLVRVLMKHGPLMDRGAMEDLCVGAGMNRFSFHAFVSWSPVISQFGHSLYGLLGTSVTDEQVEEMLARRRANRQSQRVLDDHGVTEDGKVWLKYRLSKAASTYAVITIPAALKKIVRGRFRLLSPDGQAIGTLATKDGRAWGLGAYLRGRGARFGDQVLLTIDVGGRSATVIWKRVEDKEKRLAMKDRG